MPHETLTPCHFRVHAQRAVHLQPITLSQEMLCRDTPTPHTQGQRLVFNAREQHGPAGQRQSLLSRAALWHLQGLFNHLSRSGRVNQ